jgi:hypothetical protein
MGYDDRQPIENLKERWIVIRFARKPKILSNKVRRKRGKGSE